MIEVATSVSIGMLDGSTIRLLEQRAQSLVFVRLQKSTETGHAQID